MEGTYEDSSDFESFDKEKFKKSFCKDDAQIESAEKILKVGVEAFYDHYISNHYKALSELSRSLRECQFKILSELPSVNSMKTRVKDPYHFIDKLVRKVNKKSEYTDVTLNNYHMFFDDLLGFRLIMLYAEDWYDIHNEIIKLFPCDESKFLGKSQRKQSGISQPHMIAMPEINIRNGDNEEIYSSRFSDPLKNHFIVKNGRYYRSIHYSVFNGQYCFEIQVRSVYDEAWGEIDHDALYPNLLDCKSLTNYSGMLNRIAGLSNELSSFFKFEIVPKLSQDFTPVPTLKSVPDELQQIRANTAAASFPSADTDTKVENIINKITGGEMI